jgi:hypothetical protein
MINMPRFITAIKNPAISGRVYLRSSHFEFEKCPGIFNSNGFLFFIIEISLI